MANITIRNLGEWMQARLRQRAERHGRSMEEEARTLLRKALAEDETSAPNLVDSIRARFKKLGGVELELPPRQPMRDPPKFGR